VDFNGDRKPDVALVCGYIFFVLLNNGDGTLREVSHTDLSAFFNPGLATISTAGDLNNDGKQDLVITAPSLERLQDIL